MGNKWIKTLGLVGSSALLLAASAGYSSAAHAGQNQIIGAVIGAGAGSVIGREFGGRDGAIVGAAIGAAVGSAVTRGHGQHGYTTPVHYEPPVRRAPPVVYYPPVLPAPVILPPHRVIYRDCEPVRHVHGRRDSRYGHDGRFDRHPDPGYGRRYGH